MPSTNTDPTIGVAIKIRDRLHGTPTSISREFREFLPGRGSSANRMDAQTCEAAALMLKKLGNEVTRLRLAIGNHLYGHMSRSVLYDVANSWDSGPAGGSIEEIKALMEII